MKSLRTILASPIYFITFACYCLMLTFGYLALKIEGYE